MSDTADAGAARARALTFDAIVRDHSDAIVRYFARRAEPAIAEDLAADVFEIAWRRRAQVPMDAALPWLYATAGNVLRNHRRKAQAITGEFAERHAPAFVGSDPELSAIADEEVRAALSLVDGRDREVLLLRAWEGLDGAGIAAVLGISRSGADAALSRARARLREAWAAAGHEPR